jgi:hypothetical protein
MPLIYNKNNKGPSTDPWGTPALTRPESDSSFLTHIHDKYTSAGNTYIHDKYTSAGHTESFCLDKITIKSSFLFLALYYFYYILMTLQIT